MSDKTQSEGSAKEEDTNQWGTHLMGAPANPSTHPDNQKAALWQAGDHQQMYFHHQQQQPQHPYLLLTPVDKPPANPYETVSTMFNAWSRNAETLARNIWHNLRTAPSVSEAVCGKIGVTVKAISEGGFESLFKQSFQTDPSEKLKKSFACYLSTTTGPVAGTLYLSTHRVGFCSDRPLSFVAPSGEEAWSYYKVVVALGRVSAVSPVSVRENERYVQIVTIDGHEFWFMGFVNFEKAVHHLLESVAGFRSSEAGGASVEDSPP